ncbi:MAG: ATP-binding protein [Nitrospirae bacterium]|nr:MAG: ATP-binding protein [Nitrospirota bacterium]
MPPFVDRDAEITDLLHRLRGEGPQLLILYGRRRVGKTRLVKELFDRLEGRPRLYYLATLKESRLQLQDLQRDLAQATADPLLAGRPFEEWEPLLLYLAQRHPNLVLALDEFPYLLSADPALASVLQKVWDEHGKGAGVKWLLLGSQLGVMERLLAGSSPLYGRRTGAWKVRPMGFLELCTFGGVRGLEALRYFGVCGGMPYYWEQFAFDDFAGEVERAVWRRGGPLYDEGEFLLREELREPREYFSILQVLARGPRRLGHIATAVGKKQTGISKYLDVLQGLEMVRRELPVTRQHRKGSRGLYRIHDPFLRFWFRYVFPQRSLLEMGEVEAVAARFRDSYPEFLALTYEEVALELLLRRARATGLAVERWGRWWPERGGSRFELDVVVVGEGEAWCLEAKIGSRPRLGRFREAAAAFLADARANGLALRRARLFAFEADGAFEGKEVGVVQAG